MVYTLTFSRIITYKLVLLIIQHLRESTIYRIFTYTLAFLRTSNKNLTDIAFYKCYIGIDLINNLRINHVNNYLCKGIIKKFVDHSSWFICMIILNNNF